MTKIITGLRKAGNIRPDDSIGARSYFWMIAFVLSFSIGFADLTVSALLGSARLSSFSEIGLPFAATVGLTLLAYLLLFLPLKLWTSRGSKFSVFSAAVALAVIIGSLFAFFKLVGIVLSVAQIKSAFLTKASAVFFSVCSASGL